MRTRVWCTAWVVGILIVACSADQQTGPAIRYGEEVCTECRMLISEARFAAACLTVGGEIRKFDNVGCMVHYYKDQRKVVQHLWVHDYQGNDWLDARQAWFVHSPDLLTPMGYGIVALATNQQAKRLAQQAKGQVIPFQPLVAFLPPSPNKGEHSTVPAYSQQP